MPKSARKMIETSKGHSCCHEGTLTSVIWKNSIIKIKIIMDYNALNNTGQYESILVLIN